MTDSRGVASGGAADRITVGRTDRAPEANRWPSWVRDLVRYLPLRSQFVLCGNIRDLHFVPIGGSLEPVHILDAIWEALLEQGYTSMFVFDSVDGLALRAVGDADREMANRLVQADWNGDRAPADPEMLPGILSAFVHAQPPEGAKAGPHRSAFVIDYASRLSVRPGQPSAVEHRLFRVTEKLSHTARPRLVGEGGRVAFNPILWLVEEESDLPSWFLVGNESVHVHTIARPGRVDRRLAAGVLARKVPGYVELDAPSRATQLDLLTDATEGLTIRSLATICQLARAENLPLRQIETAVTCYKFGVKDDPWQDPELRRRLSTAESAIQARVLGQPFAVTKAMDVLRRGVLGLTGSSGPRSSGRPRGVLFFAGPTGVGKTQLAKEISEHVLGMPDSYIRFDMSEFAAEHAEARLLGAPPGYVGHDAGGELTNAVRERPFSIILFDEIEKAHPRILDKFLQILEDGRLTDGRGRTTYFSQAVLVFTSNKGIVEEVPLAGGGVERRMRVDPNTAYKPMRDIVGQAIREFFRSEIQRPELLNRFGDNIIVFDFIRPTIAPTILQQKLDTTRARLREVLTLDLELSEAAIAALYEICFKDPANGARGIENLLESRLVNPLARACFDLVEREERRVLVRGLSEEDGIPELDLQWLSA